MRALLTAALAVALAACGGVGAGSGRQTVTATTTQAADLARQVAGRDATVQQILRPNTDPHEYEVRPGDVRALARSRLVVRSGGDVDSWLGAAIDAGGTKPRVLTLLDHVRPRVDKGEVDPHWWQDPRNAQLAVARIRDSLAAADPAHARGYERRAAAYLARLRALDAAVARCWARVPPAQRTLVTTHDALGYYASRYGLTVIGTVIPSLSTQGQASAGDIDALVQTIRRAGVKAIFAESSVNPKVATAVAREAGARVGPALWADSLGPAGSSGATYAGSIAANTRALVGALTAGAVRCPGV